MVPAFTVDQAAKGMLAGELDKVQFWQCGTGTPMNARQMRVPNRVLDGMEGDGRSTGYGSIK